MVPDSLLQLAEMQESELHERLERLPLDRYALRTVEATFGGNDILGVATLVRAWHASQAVCLLETKEGARATGFLVADGIVLTNNHTFVGEENARQAEPADGEGTTATFDFELDVSGVWKRPRRVACAPDRVFEAGRSLDFAIVALSSAEDLPASLELASSQDVTEGDDVFIVQHPNGGPK